MFTHHPDRSLLNPKFDGYKLDPISTKDTVTNHALQFKATQATVSGRHLFSFQEAQSRIRHNHISVSPGGEQAVYIDANLHVVLVRLEHDTIRPSFSVVYELPALLQTPASEAYQREYPSSAFLDGHTLVCADGHGTLYVLSLPSTGSANLLGSYALPSTLRPTLSSPIPFRLHGAWSRDAQAIAILSFKHFKEAAPGALPSQKVPPAEFDITAVRVPLHPANDPSSISALDLAWHRRGSNVPLYVAYEKLRSVFVLVGGAPYQPIGQPAIARPEPSPDELAPIPRADEALPAEPPRPPPYAWTQDTEEITIALPFPSGTRKTDITVLFSPQTLTVLVEGHDAPRYAAAPLWGGIAPAASFWTWDAHGAHAYGVLTLHLEKQHAGTRWPHVFDARGAQTEVAETLDPSELYAIRESLEKYTAALQEGGGARPSLADGEADEEVDATVGAEACVTWVGVDGTEPAWAREDHDVPFTVLATPLPGIGAEDVSVVVKHTIDGLVFKLTGADAANGLPVWTHESTYSALAFVLASKRDTRFTYYVPSKGVLAFEGGGLEYGGNLYIYRDAKPKNNWAKQAILKLVSGMSGSLLGVGAVSVGTQTVLLCLCENELVVLRGVI
ncbi:hypothetical protein BC834DRAFT_819472 [Gloeopeniophorella convolvens]|nr:hypothetical protein BC834DRAFT_819472 [Gloeopeniophorella convolvens]